MTPYGPPAESQFQPAIATSAKDCVPNTTRKLIRRATVDRKAPSTASVRSHSGAPSTRGLSYGEASTAAAYWGVTLVPSYGNDRDEVLDLSDAGHPFGLSGDCSVTVGGPRATNSFTGDHTVYVNDVRHVAVGGACKCEKGSAASAHNEYLIEDPGNSSKGYQWWSASLVYRFGEARTRDHLGISHGINLLVGPDTEDRTWHALGAAQIRSEPSYATGKRVGTLVKGRAYSCGRTQAGGTWARSDGTGNGNGWIHVNGLGWSKGGAFV